jgi:hypothetical protein
MELGLGSEEFLEWKSDKKVHSATYVSDILLG